ncbi:BrnA antitoxin family protein [Rhizobium puerariae]|uniref:BrnA antitoxin family protein n=1 Tax=Rhizobium puerariae TaxID=1585791 RepID=A0ABV6A9P6_9HYPH
MSKLPKHIKPITDEEEAEIQRQIAADPDDEDLSDEAAKRPMTFAQALQRQRGRPPVETPRRQISIRLDPEVIDHYKATGKGWQGRLNDDLRKAAGL